MRDNNQSFDSGIASLSGFAFQIKVFILLLGSLQNGERLGFETLDDIAKEIIIHDDSDNDMCIKTKTDNSNKITVFQVKQTNVTPAKSRDILYNWLLALNLHRNISHFKLYIDDGYSVNDKVFKNNYSIEYDFIISSTKGKSALISKIKSIYFGNEEQFRQDFDYIANNYTTEKIDDIDKKIMDVYSTALHLDAKSIGAVYAKQRLKELFTITCARIIDCISQRKPFYCIREEIMQVCDEICRNISPDKYMPDYSSFKQLHSFSKVSDTVKATRAYRQLQYCNLDAPNTMMHLLWQQYYGNIRNHYLMDAQQNIVDGIEDVASENHKNVVIELQEFGKDTPRLRLVKTKAKPIYALSDEHSCWGAYVFLTNDTGPNMISWKDDDNE